MTTRGWSGLALSLVASAALAQVPTKLGYQGRLLKADGRPEQGLVAIDFAIFAAATGGSPLWGETQLIGLSDGYYATHLGDADAGPGIPASVFDGSERYLQLTVAGNALLPRQRISSVAYAYRAARAQSLSGGPVDATSLAINGVPLFNGSGQLVGAALTAGPGITVDGGTISARFGNGTDDVCRGDDPRLSDARAPAGPASGDLGGTYPSPVVTQLQGRPMSAGAPPSGAVLGWSGTQWAPARNPLGQGNWCGLSFTNAGTASTISANGAQPAAFSIPCEGLNPVTACPVGYTQIQACSSGLIDTALDCLFTCVRT